MDSNIEIEAKVLLSKTQYDQIISAMELDKYRKVKQTNHYIDTPDSFLKNNGIALRIREKNEEFELTLKTPLSEGLLEKNEKISWRDFDLLKDNQIFPKGNVSQFLEILGVNIKQLNILAYLTTERIEVEYKAGLIALDKNTYSNIVDYELEVESTSMDNAKQLATEILNSAGISEFEFNQISKQNRALRSTGK